MSKSHDFEGTNMYNFGISFLLYFSDRSKRRERVRTELMKAGTKQKKGFMTPERKKKLRVTSLPS